MLNSQVLKTGAMVTLCLFLVFTLSQSYSFAQTTEKSLEKKLQKFFFEGDLEGAINMLKDYIEKIKNIETKKKELAQAYYHLAKTCFKAGLTDSVKLNLKKAYQTCPTLQMDELDPEFKEQSEKVKKQVALEKEKEESKPKTEPKILEEKKPEPKKDTKKVVEEKTPPITTAVTPKKAEPEDQTLKPETAVKEEKTETVEPEIKPKKEEQKVLEKPGEKKKKKKKFPWLLVIGGVVVVAAAILLLSSGSDKDPTKGYLQVNNLSSKKIYFEAINKTTKVSELSPFIEPGDKEFISLEPGSYDVMIFEFSGYWYLAGSAYVDISTGNTEIIVWED